MNVFTRMKYTFIFLGIKISKGIEFYKLWIAWCKEFNTRLKESIAKSRTTQI
jgi:hypothetical protein